jgi:hypothetical protein
MLILFDQGTPVAIRACLQKHTVTTAHKQGWSTLSNGELLRESERAGFDVLLTTDQNLIHQQNLSGLTIAIVVLGKARWSLIEPVLDRIANAVDEAKPGSYTLVDIPE